MDNIDKKIRKSISEEYESLALIDKKSFKIAIESEYELLRPFIEIYKRENEYMKENGKWDFDLISKDVNLSVTTCRKWMKRIKTTLEK